MSDAEKWVVVFESGTDYESEIVRDRLDDSGIPAVVETKRDHAFFLNVGSMANVYVRVPAAYAQDAFDLLSQPGLSSAELEAAALGADPTTNLDLDVGDLDEDEADNRGREEED